MTEVLSLLIVTKTPFRRLAVNTPLTLLLFRPRAMPLGVICKLAVGGVCGWSRLVVLRIVYMIIGSAGVARERASHIILTFADGFRCLSYGERPSMPEPHGSLKVLVRVGPRFRPAIW